jgi:predicted dehydrogenase
MSSENISSRITPENPVTLYLAGAGAVTHHIAGMIGRAVDQGKLRIGGVFDPSAENRSVFVERLGIAEDFPHFSSYDEMLHTIQQNEDLCKLMGIFSPVRFHGDQATKALMNGTSVAIMKPMANSAEDAKQIISLGNSMNKVIHCSPTHRNIPAYMQARSWILNGEIGSVLRLDHRSVFAGHELTEHTDAKGWYIGENGTVLEDLFPYPADITHALLGGLPNEVLAESRQSLPIRWQNGKEINVAGPDYWYLLYKYTDPFAQQKTLASIEVGFVPSNPDDWRTMIRGSLGSIAIHSGGQNIYTAELYDRMGEKLDELEAGIGLPPGFNDEDAHVFKDVFTAAERVRMSVHSQEQVKNISAENALGTLTVIKAIGEAQNTGEFRTV